MGFQKRDNRARFKRDDSDVHIVAHIAGINKAGRGPFPVSIGHHGRGQVIIIGDDNIRQSQANNLFVRFAYPMKAQDLCALVVQGPI